MTNNRESRWRVGGIGLTGVARSTRHYAFALYSVCFNEAKCLSVNFGDLDCHDDSNGSELARRSTEYAVDSGTFA